MTTFYLVRHGQTGLIGKKLCGTLPGIHLNDEGKRQAQKVADYLGSFPIKAVFSSPLERAVETAAPLADRLGLTVDIRDFLSEVDFGDLQGKQREELASLEIWQRFNLNPSDVEFPNGESIKGAQKRVAEGLNHLCSQFAPNDQIVCVAHSEILRQAVAAAINLPIEFSHRLSIEPASITKLEWVSERWKLRLLNFFPV